MVAALVNPTKHPDPPGVLSNEDSLATVEMTLPTLYEIMHNNPWLRPKPPSPRHRSIPIDDAAAADAGADAGGSGGGGGDDDDAAADANGEAVDSTAGEPSPPASPGSACSGGSLPMVDLSEDQERELQALHDCIADNKLEAVYEWLTDIPNFTDDEDDEALGGDMDGEGDGATRGRTGGRTCLCR